MATAKATMPATIVPTASERCVPGFAGITASKFGKPNALQATCAASGAARLPVRSRRAPANVPNSTVYVICNAQAAGCAMVTKSLLERSKVTWWCACASENAKAAVRIAGHGARCP
mmetsp:Transcript_5984/g.15546  ORF Transcript_5984/g.15546 Transcript_5984/m.15546 type:complete len:116 (-) Transcript_5984:34-381(-)